MALRDPQLGPESGLGSSGTPGPRPARRPRRSDERTLLELIDRAPGRVWHGKELVAASGLDTIDVAAALSRLRASGHLERVGPGRYRRIRA
jgi:hypothetical protein